MIGKDRVTAYRKEYVLATMRTFPSNILCNLIRTHDVYINPVGGFCLSIVRCIPQLSIEFWNAKPFSGIVEVGEGRIFRKTKHVYLKRNFS